MTDARPPSEAASDIAEQDAFALIHEAACIAQDHAEQLADAAMRGDPARARLHACLLSRATSCALLTVQDILDERRA